MIEKNNLYATNIVFGKYQNVVILSSLYEYLMAGRCSSLEGENGAYNIYEQESRADIIISELNKVIDCLEDIKSSQYMIYREIQDVNYNLKTLNKSMNDVIDSLENTNDKLTEILETSQVIAYNTFATAYYSKINAELTNSLGFMTALK